MYSIANSLSPMMFGKSKGRKEARKRSRSLENILDHADGPVAEGPRAARAGTAQPVMNIERPQWKELNLVKSTSPVVTCVLPAVARDFVCSALLAVGATPLIVEDPMDMDKDLSNCKAVLVDVSASRILVEAFIEEYVPGQCPLVLVTSECGSSDRRKELAQRVIEENGPTVISGRLADIYSVSQDILEKAGGSIDNDIDSDSDVETKPQQKDSACSLPSETATPPTIRRIRATNDRKASLPTVLASAKKSPRHSPRTSPRCSPTSSPRGVRRKLKGAGLARVPTALPRVQMKGQFRDSSLPQCSVNDAMEMAQLLAAHTEAFIHLYCTNVVTNGETIIELANSQIGMCNLHSTLSCCGAVVAAVLACVEECDDVTVKECGHALALYYVAGEEAAIETSNAEGLIPPGTLRRNLIDALHYLDEPTVRTKAQLFAHLAGTSPVSQCPA